MTYRPSEAVAAILKYALQEVNSVPYQVTMRWVFYQLVQRYGLSKNAYGQFKGYASKARKEFYEGWRPDTLADDTRWIDERGQGYGTKAQWMQTLRNARCELSVRAEQPNALLVLFEAAAMRRQFEHYLEPLRVPSAPFQGDPSIPHKWTVAQYLRKERRGRMVFARKAANVGVATERAYQVSRKPVVCLYFGDRDPKGDSIPISALRDIWQWMEPSKLGLGSTLHRLDPAGREWTNDDRSFRWIRVGLNAEQVTDLNIPENPEKPGQYQWEALNDEQAGQMILGAVRQHWDPAIVEKVGRREKLEQKRWQSAFDRMFPGYDTTPQDDAT